MAFFSVRLHFHMDDEKKEPTIQKDLLGMEISLSGFRKINVFFSLSFSLAFFVDYKPWMVSKKWWLCAGHKHGSRDRPIWQAED